MIAYLVVTAFVAILAGVGLAQRCRAFVMLPAMALMCAASTASGLTLNAGIWPTVLAALVGIISLQMGFLGSAALGDIDIRPDAAQPHNAGSAGFAG